MEETHRPFSYPYMQPVPASLVTQPALYPSRPWSQQQSTQDPLLTPRPTDQLPSTDQPSLICGFTATELAHVALQVAGVTIAAVFGAWAIKAYESANVANKLSESSLSQSKTANRLAGDALKQSLYANVLSIINLCLSDQYRDSAVCPAVLEESRFSSVVRSVIPNLSIASTTTQRTTTTSTFASASASTSRSSSSTTSTRSTRPTSSLNDGLPAPTPTKTADVGDSIQVESPKHPLPFGAIVGIIIGVIFFVAVSCLLLIRYRRARAKRSRI